MLQPPDESFDFIDEIPEAQWLLAAERARTKHERTCYYVTAMLWRALGFNVIPGNIDKVPLVEFADLSGEHPRELCEAQIVQWSMGFPDATPLLLPDSGRVFRLVGVDADDPKMSPWIESQYGLTPFVVKTGRDGGGAHHYYLCPAGVHVTGRNMIIGPDDCVSWDYAIVDGRIKKSKRWGRTAIDVKARRCYLVAPGATHKSGRKYLPAMPLEGLSPDWFIANLPIFDVDLYERHVAESTARKIARHKLIWDANPQSVARPTTGTSAAFDTTDAGLPAEPFLAWCAAEPEAVNLHTWWGLASNLAAVFGETGRAEFHRLSALSVKYKSNETDRTYTKALRSAGPSSYSALRQAGYYGPIPEGFRSPAGYLRNGSADAQMVVADAVDAIDDLALDDLEPTEPVPNPDFERDVDLVWSRWRELNCEVQAELVDRVQRRRDAAAALDQQVVQEARAVVAVGKKLLPRFRKKYRDGGIPWHRCGFAQGLVNVNNFEQAANRRLCRSRQCGKCGPWAMAVQAAALADMPPVRDGQVVGLPVSMSAILNVYYVNSGHFHAWKDCLARTCKSSNPNRGLEHLQEPVFIAFRFGPVFTVATPVDVPYRWAWQSLAEPRVCGEDAIRNWVYNMVDATYRIVDDPLEGLVVEGRISTPQTLITDPHDIVLKATVFPMAVVEPRVESIGAAEAAFEANGVQIKSLRRDAESGTKTSMVTVPVWNLSKSAEIWESVAVRTPPRPPSPAVQPPGLDDEIDELLDP